MKKLIILSFIAIINLSANFTLKNQDDKNIQIIKEIVKNSQKEIPQNINTKMVITDIIYHEKEKTIENIIYFSSLEKIEMKTMQMNKVLKKAIIVNICPSKLTQKILNLDHSIIYNFTDKYGDSFYMEKITKKLCKSKL
jgi:hypothetical protein